MRGPVWMVLLLLLPAASGLTPLLPSDDHGERGVEQILVLNEGVWTSEQWAALVGEGIQPLRTVRSDALLVWAEHNQESWPVDAKIEAAQDAEIRRGLVAPTEAMEYRVLLEPRLPSDGVNQVLTVIDALGLSVKATSLDVAGNLPASITLDATNEEFLNPLLEADGVLWVEPVLATQARNGQASALMEAGVLDEHPYWVMGLDGSGIVVGVADSGIDADHACFRNATTPTSEHAETDATYPAVGIFGDDHRKIVHLNTDIDGNDTPGHSDYRHGTHVIGSLACHDVENFRQGTAPTNGSTLAHGSRLVVQDIVSSNGWEPPNVDELLWESSSFGGVVHSNSWGDDTTAYTERTARFDAYARVMPWSLALIAPGNSGEGVLEPANGRNVVAVSATTKSLEGERWGSSAYGPTEAGTDGIFLLAPGSNIESAGADGFWDTNNNNLRLSSGTSMSTPHASGAAVVIQQLYEDGWLVPAFAPTTTHYLNDMIPVWAETAPLGASVQLGEGFTPSGSLLRASLAMAASPLPEATRNGGEGGHDLHNPYDGWGALNLSRLYDPTTIEGLGESPAEDTWVHDSYRLTSGTVEEWFETNKGETEDIFGLISSGAPLNNSVGPFLETGDMFSQRLTVIEGEDVRIRMAFPAQPEPAMVDDLQLRVRLEDGTILLPDRLREGGFAPTEFYPDVVDTNNTTAFPPSNQTVFGLDIPQSYLYGSSYLDVDVIARFVQPGGAEGSSGLDGDAVGFALVVKGVQRDASYHMDDDGDGIMNIDDACPNVAAPPSFDADKDGCLDDGDGDGVPNKDDACPYVKAEPSHDLDRDGCPDDDDGDGVPNYQDLCPDDSATFLDENGDGCNDVAQWYIDLTVIDVCFSTYSVVCSVDVRSIDVKIDGRTVHEFRGGHSDIMPLNTHGGEHSWMYIFSKSEEENLETFTEVELNLEMKFTHTPYSTSGRQWGWNDPCWPVGCYYGPAVNWEFEVQLQNGMNAQNHHDERIASISSSQYIVTPDFATHTFTWSKDPTVDVDGDGFSVPGLTYSGPCTDSPCSVQRNNVLDAFPFEETQWSDRDGDGFGDNPSGYLGDAFPDDPFEWEDEDEDGVGSNSDSCPSTYGTSTLSGVIGCPDQDGDGHADRYDVCPNVFGSSYLYGAAGCPDSDYDGYADPGFEEVSTALVDQCPNEQGFASNGDYVGCLDSDGDGWADVEDDLPYDGRFWIDSDGDGVPDDEDDYPNNALFSDNDEVSTLFCGGFCFGVLFLVAYVFKNRADPTAHKPETIEQKTWWSMEEPLVEEKNPPPAVVVGNLGEDEVP
ncbi:MAG: hypothetical protein DWC03_02300 [Candidatus Poseidoniales archaeon]|nr:MAG: hypothetical protein DWC03_02300 [Candidatus Poseidoniales archaeon]